jgi:hypothetical protein
MAVWQRGRLKVGRRNADDPKVRMLLFEVHDDPWLGLEVLGVAVGVWAGETDGGGCDDGCDDG